MRNWNEALEYIISEGAKQLNFLAKKKLHVDNGYDEKNASTHFEEDLNELSKEKAHKRILLIFDEIESITFDISPSGHWAHGDDFMYFWQAIRSIFQKNPGLFSFVIAGVNPKCVEEAIINKRDNPIYKMIRPNYLKFFTSSQVKEMVSTIGTYMGVVFDNEIYTYLSDDYGGHPFLVRDVCSYLVKKTNSERPSRVSKFLYEENKEQLNLLLNDYLELILNVLKSYYSIEYDLLAHLAAEDYETFKEFAIEFSNCISHLLGYGIVEQESSKYFFKLKSIKEYIKKTNRLQEKIEKKKESKWAVISRKRNKLEPQLRKIIETVFIPRFGLEDAKIRFLNKIGGGRAKKLENLKFHEILNGSKESEIYLDDLRKIILGYWDYFENLFGCDREKFDFYLAHINKFRIDAHSNDISEDDYSILISGFDWFEKQIKEIPFLE